MDRVGFKCMDFIGTSHSKKCVRELREDPWERIRLLSKMITRTPLSAMVHISVLGFTLSPMSIYKLCMERLAANGIRRIQTMDPSNDMNFRLPEAVKVAAQDE